MSIGSHQATRCRSQPICARGVLHRRSRSASWSACSPCSRRFHRTACARVTATFIRAPSTGQPARERPAGADDDSRRIASRQRPHDEERAADGDRIFDQRGRRSLPSAAASRARKARPRGSNDRTDNPATSPTTSAPGWRRWIHRTGRRDIAYQTEWAPCGLGCGQLIGHELGKGQGREDPRGIGVPTKPDRSGPHEPAETRGPTDRRRRGSSPEVRR